VTLDGGLILREAWGVLGGRGVKGDMMSHWGKGYKTGHRAALIKVKAWLENVSNYQSTINVDTFMDEITKDFKGGPSMYAVANHCCGGVDAHDVGCQ